MDKENDYVDYFYNKYEGRVAIGVGYNNNITEIFPLVYQTFEGDSIGIVALDVIEDDEKVVHIYHLGAFVTRQGDGSKILKELCDQADLFNIWLSVSAIVMPNGKKRQIKNAHLESWYKRFGFRGENGLLRKPNSENVSRASRSTGAGSDEGSSLTPQKSRY